MAKSYQRTLLIALLTVAPLFGACEQVDISGVSQPMVPTVTAKPKAAKVLKKKTRGAAITVDSDVATRGKGVQLMKLHSALVADIATIDPAKGFTWQTGSRQRREECTAWMGERAQSGRNTPVGFPKDLSFTRA